MAKLNTNQKSSAASKYLHSKNESYSYCNVATIKMLIKEAFIAGIEHSEAEPTNEKSVLPLGDVSGSTFSIEELHSMHSGLIVARPHLNDRTKGYKTTLNLINKLSGMIAEYYR